MKMNKRPFGSPYRELHAALAGPWGISKGSTANKHKPHQGTHERRRRRLQIKQHKLSAWIREGA